MAAKKKVDKPKRQPKEVAVSRVASVRSTRRGGRGRR